MIFIAAWWLGAIPLLWLCVLQRRGQVRDVSLWWLGAALGVSFVADTLAFLGVNPDYVGNLSPISQAALVGLVLLIDREDVVTLLGVLGGVGVAAMLWNGPLGFDVLIATVANLAVVVIAYEFRALDRLRLSLLVYFGLGCLAWWWDAYEGDLFRSGVTMPDVWGLSPSMWTFLCYQCTRALGIGLFCWAASDPKPRLALSRRTL